MRTLPLVAVSIALLGATACSYERTSAYTTDAEIAVAPATTVTADTIVTPETPIVGARDGSSASLNSENHSVITRTGINSSPNNPDGTPRPAIGGSAYSG